MQVVSTNGVVQKSDRIWLKLGHRFRGRCWKPADRTAASESFHFSSSSFSIHYRDRASKMRPKLGARAPLDCAGNSGATTFSDRDVASDVSRIQKR